MTQEDQSLQLPLLERFVVPPLVIKSAYYRTPLIRQLWQDAFKALRSPRRISLIGYSLPLTDVESEMLMEAVEDRPMTVEVVNACPNPVLRRMEVLAGSSQPPDLLTATDGDCCVEKWALGLRDEASATVAEDLANRSY